MFPIRRRWPILTGLAALLVYGANHYQIAGLEHLRLESRPSTQQSPTSATANPLLGVYGIPELDATQFGINTPIFPDSVAGLPEFTSNTSADRPWHDMLHAGEKFTLLENQLLSKGGFASAPAPFAPVAESSIPVSTPIPAPSGFFDKKSVPSHLLPLLPPPGTLPTTDRLPAAAPTTSNASTRDKLPAGNMVGLPTGESTVPVASAMRDSQRIRVASFNVQSLGPAKLTKPHVIAALVSILRQYDVVALQEIRSDRDDILPLVVERLNQSGRRYDYLIGPRVGRAAPHDQFAFVFDTQRLETDRYQLYTVDDPEDLVTFEPLVAWFRCKEVPRNDAFTFSLVNLRIDPNRADRERAMLPDLIEVIQRDGRSEDDWILLGDFAGGNASLQHLETPAIRFAIRDIPTEVTGMQMLDSLIFSSRATTEFTGRSGAFDFLRKFNLTIEQAMEVSSHLPVWAEFSIVEGAEPGRIAPADPQAVY